VKKRPVLEKLDASRAEEEEATDTASKEERDMTTNRSGSELIS